MQDLSGQQNVPGWVLDEAVGPNTKLRQGDLIRFENHYDALRQAGIIVTADCDLEQRKHARLVTLIPVVTANTILEQYLIVEDCEKKRKMIEDYVFKKYSIERNQDRQIKISLLKRFLSDINLDLNQEMLKVACDFVLERADSMRIGHYKNLMKEIGSAHKSQADLKSQIRARGDLFILPDTQRLGVEGGIAWIRHIWQVPLKDIAMRTSEVSSCPGERVGRLDSPYRYRLTQLMGQVFSDIGLPEIPDRIGQLLEDAYVNI